MRHADMPTSSHYTVLSIQMLFFQANFPGLASEASYLLQVVLTSVSLLSLPLDSVTLSISCRQSPASVFIMTAVILLSD